MIRRGLIFVHRWLGVALCVPVCIWFLSGIAMMYWDFPEISAHDRLARSPALDAAKIAVSPFTAQTNLRVPQRPNDIRLSSFDGRPAYHFRIGRTESVVFADTGEVQRVVSPELVQRAAARWTSHPASDARMDEVTTVDQWTVQGALRTTRPMWKFSWPGGDQVYISGVSGEVVQATTTASRIEAYLGPIPHWIYFTSLRQRQAAWTNVVVWLSGVSCFTAVLGLIIGIWVYLPKAILPYRGAKLWHAALGLIFGVAAVTWTFSGLLSMDPFPVRATADTSDPRPRIAQALRGRVDARQFETFGPKEALAALSGSDVRELELMVFDGQPAYLATLADGTTRISKAGAPATSQLDPGRVMDIVRGAARPASLIDIHPIDRYDAYYLDRRHELPLPVVLARFDDAGHTRCYVDPKTARIVGGYSDRNWMSRWAYHGLHSLNFPWLYNYRPAWDVVVIFFMLGGAALSATSILLAWRVMASRIGGLVR